MRSAAARHLCGTSSGSHRSLVPDTAISASASRARVRLPAPSRAPSRRSCRRLYAHQTLVDPSFQHAIPPPHAGRGLSFGWAALLLVCTTLMCLASAATACILLLRPLLLNMDKASRATEKAAEELGQASREIERAALKFQTDMDKTLPEMAAASREFQELVRQDPLRASITGRSFNALGSGIADNIVGRPVAVVRGATSSSLRRVVQDVGQLTSALTPAVDDWRRRITGLASRFERLKGHTPGDMPALVEAQHNMDAAEQHVQGAQEASQQVQKWTEDHPEQSSVSQPGLQQSDSVRSAAAQASDALHKVTSDGAVLLRQLEEGGTDSDEAAAAKEGARLINDAAEAAERMAQEARSMTIAIDWASDSDPQPTASAVSAAPTAAAQNTAADNPDDSAGCTAELSGQLQTDADDAALADQQQRSRRKDETGTRVLATSSMSDAELELLEQLKDRKDAAQAVFMALERAEQAATAAAQASTSLEEALQRAERRSSMDEDDEGGSVGVLASVDVPAHELQDGMAAQMMAQ